MASSDIVYSEIYKDDTFEYRHVTLPLSVYRKAPSTHRLLTEEEWRAMGIQQSRGWEHYMIHKPEPKVFLFRRLLGTDPLTGKPPPVPPSKDPPAPPLSSSKNKT